MSNNENLENNRIKATPSKVISPVCEHYIATYLLEHEGEISFYQYQQDKTDVFGERGSGLRRKCYNRMRNLRDMKDDYPNVRDYYQMLRSLLATEAPNHRKDRTTATPAPTTPLRPSPAAATPAVIRLDVDTLPNPVAPAAPSAAATDTQTTAPQSSIMAHLNRSQPQRGEFVMNFREKEKNYYGLRPYYVHGARYKGELVDVIYCEMATFNPIDNTCFSARLTEDLENVTLQFLEESSTTPLAEDEFAKTFVEKVTKKLKKKEVGKKDIKSVLDKVVDAHAAYANKIGEMDTNSAKYHEVTFCFGNDIKVRPTGYGNQNGNICIHDIIYPVNYHKNKATTVSKVGFFLIVDSAKPQFIERNTGSRVAEFMESIEDGP